MTILFCFYDIMLVIVFCERVFYAIVTPIGRNFAYRESKKCIQGRRLFLRVCSAKTGKSAVEITPKMNLHAPLDIGNKVKTSTLNMQ